MYDKPTTIFNEMIAQKIWVNDPGKDRIVSEVKKMIADDVFSLPTENNESKSFGSFSKEIFQKDALPFKDYKPIFDRYHHQERSHDIKFWEVEDEDLNDLLATLFSFTFRLTVKGQITKLNDKYKINISDIAIYVRDGFNFIDDGWKILISQPLGYWSLKESATSVRRKSSNYYYVNNDSYNDWRKLHGKGGDFELYSTLKIIENVDDSFEVGANLFST